MERGKITFDKYKSKHIVQIIYPKDGYKYSYCWSKDIGWHIVKGQKLPEFISGATWKNDFDIKEMK